MTKQRLIRALGWLLIASLLLLALHPKHPLLFALRPCETGLLLILGLAGAGRAVLAARRGALGRIEAGATVAACLAIVALAAAHEADFQLTKARVLAADPATRALGQRFVVGFSDWSDARRLAERDLIGGVYLSRGNVRGRTLTEIRSEIEGLQTARSRAGLPPLIVAADQEGGSVQHLSPPLPAMPPLASLLTAGSNAGLEARAMRYGQTQGSALAALGVTLNLGPVVDLRPQLGGPSFDTHTRIVTRAIASDPKLVSRIARAYGDGLASTGVQPTLKHFPGLRHASADTHHFPARLNQPTAVLANADWQPFRQAGPAIMLGHVIVPELDPEHPASLSPRIIGGLLRDSWNYDGILITDDLSMGAVYRRGICTAAIQALAAGADLLLISYDPDQYFRAMACAADALRRGDLPARGLVDSRRRIGRLSARGSRRRSGAGRRSVGFFASCRTIDARSCIRRGRTGHSANSLAFDAADPPRTSKMRPPSHLPTQAGAARRDLSCNSANTPTADARSVVLQTENQPP